jgi:FlaA1/EpsC-like NDP-sugar epimerase
VRNNVLGTLRVVECAARHRAEKFVLISTDKAVNPSSIMGATKRLAEQIVLGWRGRDESVTDFRAVRFGNVLGSDGSVIPLFKKQLAAGGPLTVTHPEVRRYFMTIPEAVQLVLQAAALPEAAGRISMLDMGEPIRILDLAEQLIRLSGRIPYRDVGIVFTGLRPGEKLHEELMSTLEFSLPTVMEKIRIVRTEGVAGVRLEAGLKRLFAATASGSRDAVVHELGALVPEYRFLTADESAREAPLPSSTDADVGLNRKLGRPVVPSATSSLALADFRAAFGGIERPVSTVAAPD